MAKYNVTKTGKDSDGDITFLCGHGFRHSKQEAINNINCGLAEYYVKNRTEIKVVDDNTKGQYLRTIPNSNTDDNLDCLPDC